MKIVIGMEPHVFQSKNDVIQKWRSTFDLLVGFSNISDIRILYSCHLHRKILSKGPQIPKNLLQRKKSYSSFCIKL